MKKSCLFGLLLLSTGAWPTTFEQYPEERTYRIGESNYKQYGASSLHQTGKFSLTFDDGPHPTYTPKLLDTLKKFEAKATFFVITSQINENNFPIIKRMLDEGHIVGSHGRSHDNSNTLTKEQWKSRVKQSFLDLNKWYTRAGHSMTKLYYRFPYAAYGTRKDYNHMNALKELSQDLYGENCIQFAFWDIDSGDWIPGMSGKEIAQNFQASHQGGKFTGYKTVKNSRGQKVQIKVSTQIKNPTAGGVVLQHDIQLGTLEGTELLLSYVKDNNLEIVPLDEVEEFKVLRSCELKTLAGH